MRVFYATDSGIHSVDVPYRADAIDGRLSPEELDQVLSRHEWPNGSRIVGVECEGRSYRLLEDIGARSVRPVHSMPASRLARRT